MSPHNKHKNGTPNGTPAGKDAVSNEIVLTDIVVRNLKPKEKRVDYSVMGMPGLFVRVQPSGRKTFSCLYRLDGQRKRVTFGKYGEISVHEAIAKYAATMEKVDKGLDPSEEAAESKRTKKEAGSIADLIERYEKYSISIGKKDVKNEITSLKSNIGKKLANKPVSKITRKDCSEVLNDIVLRDAPSQANHVFQYMRRMFALAMDWGLLEKNPMQDMKKPAPLSKKRRVLNYRELYLFLKKWPQYSASSAMKSLILFMLYTAVRSGEARLSKWKDVDYQGRFLRLDETKNSMDMIVPLNSYASECLSAMEELTKGAEYIFSLTSDERVIDNGVEYFQPLSKTSPSQAIRRFLNSPLGEGIEHFSPHDLRRSAATHLTSLGVPTYWVRMLLNHKDGSVTRQHYDLYSYIKEKRTAVDIWAFALDEILSAPDEDSIIGLESLRDKVEAKFFSDIQK